MDPRQGLTVNPDLDLVRVDRILSGTRLRRAFWRALHKMPCAVVHRVCPLCRDEDLCNRCVGDALLNGSPTYLTLASGQGYYVATGSSTSSTGTTTTYRFKA